MPGDIERFLDRLVSEAPALAVVEEVVVGDVDVVDDDAGTAGGAFAIVGSRSGRAPPP